MRARPSLRRSVTSFSSLRTPMTSRTWSTPRRRRARRQRHAWSLSSRTGYARRNFSWKPRQTRDRVPRLRGNSEDPISPISLTPHRRPSGSPGRLHSGTARSRSCPIEITSTCAWVLFVLECRGKLGRRASSPCRLSHPSFWSRARFSSVIGRLCCGRPPGKSRSVGPGQPGLSEVVGTRAFGSERERRAEEQNERTARETRVRAPA